MNKKSPVVSHILFDLDNTLLDTSSIFNNTKEEILKHWQDTLKDVTKVKGLNLEYERLLAEGFYKYAVNPQKLWKHVFDGLKNKFPFFIDIHDYTQQRIEFLYTQVPPLYPNALELLQSLKDGNKKIYLVTHAEPDWTDFKVDSVGIRSYFEDIFVCDCNKHKSIEDWREALKKFGLSAHNVAIAGDSVKGDIIPAHQLGAAQIFWVNFEGGWHVYREGEIPAGIIEIKDLSEISAHL